MKYPPCRDFRSLVKKMMACGHWRDGERVVGDHAALIEHIASGKSLAYGLHAGNDRNGPRNLGTQAEKMCGCVFVDPRGRKQSRKAFRGSGFNLDAAARDRRASGQSQPWSAGESTPAQLRIERANLVAQLDAMPNAGPNTRQLQRILAIDRQLRTIPSSTDTLGDTA